MKRSVHLAALIVVLVLCSSCGEETQIEETATPPPLEKQDTPAVIEKFVQPEKYVLADDDFSNLQLTDITKPVYDKHGFWERHDKGLATRFPEITPYDSENVVYLTFDDGPDNKNTPLILDILKSENVPATFFVCGNRIEENPEVLKRIFNEGHAIGNHSYNHSYRELYRSPWDFIAQFMKTDDIIMEQIGVRPLIIRAPGGTAGVFNYEYWDMVDASGYAEFDWNLSNEDATSKRPTAEVQLRYVTEQLDELCKSNAILLMHSIESKDETVRALPSIIKLFKDRGYKFGVVTPMTPQPW